jgi:hypothetical protein
VGLSLRPKEARGPPLSTGKVEVTCERSPTHRDTLYQN